jgi:hypothetical protein
MSRLFLIAAALIACDALLVAPVTPRVISAHRVPLVRMQEEEPAAETAEEAPAPPPPPRRYEAPDEKFLGVFDVNTPDGALFASIVVSVSFVVGVEFVKFLDPNNVGEASWFGSLSTIGK